uniref:Ribosomal protein S10 domain-containing protein n=1 Tax=Meloidogyne incognita TaxID=6306 RepID=A0A914LRT3_MELIC
MKILFKNCQRNFNNNIFFRGLSTLKEKVNVPKSEDLYEPRFEVKRHYPDLQLINVKLKAFDFQTLEKFQAFVHWTAENFGFDVVECYPLAHKCEKIKEFKENSVTISTEYELKTYARVVRIGPVPAIQLPLFVMMVQANAPVGVQVNIKEHEASDEVERYIPDPQLDDFKETLRNLDDPVVRKFLGWEA